MIAPHCSNGAGSQLAAANSLNPALQGVDFRDIATHVIAAPLTREEPKAARVTSLEQLTRLA